MRKQTHLLDEVLVRSVDLSALEVIKPVNKKLFGEDRIINDLNQRDLLILIAYVGDIPAGFKLGYGLDSSTFYSAKSGVLPEYRREGVASKLLYRMMLEVKKKGYECMVFDTLPKRFPGMINLGLKEGFLPISVEWNSVYDDYQVRLKLKL
ncbi:MAG: GNAT family N-acetyltransferase [Balneolales bacterium]